MFHINGLIFHLLCARAQANINNLMLCISGTLSRTSVLTKLTNARTNVQNWNKVRIICSSSARDNN